MRFLLRLLVPACVLACALASPALASESLTDFNAGFRSFSVNKKGEALVTYKRSNGQVRHVLAWGAVNANAPVDPAIRQIRFRFDYAGGWGKYRNAKYWRTFKNACAPYDGPTLPYVVAACKAPDGSYWALQSWARPLPNLGFAPWSSELRQQWLEVSHWRGELPQLELHMGWVWSNRFQQLFGRYTYRGKPVYGFGTTRYGAPTDGFGRLVYLDTLNSTYGSGWKRENSFVPHNPTGVFCYGFYSFDPSKGGYRHPPGYAVGKRGQGKD